MNSYSYEFNLKQLSIIAKALADLLPRVTFVGGCTTVLLVDEAAYSGVRQTDDVDVIVDVGTYLEYQHFSTALRERGFVEDISGPICRWLYGSNGTKIKLDVMSADAKALGFTNRWYKDSLHRTFNHPLHDDYRLRLLIQFIFWQPNLKPF